LVIAVALCHAALSCFPANAQEESNDASQQGATPVAVQASEAQRKNPTILGQAAAEELEALYTELLVEINEEREVAVSELIQVHRMAVEARELGGNLYQNLNFDWQTAAVDRASQLAKLTLRWYEAGELSLMQVRLARANEKLTIARNAAWVEARAAAQAAAKANQPRPRRRSVVLPPSGK
jgi:hypothetical protein